MLIYIYTCMRNLQMFLIELSYLTITTAFVFRYYAMHLARSRGALESIYAVSKLSTPFLPTAVPSSIK